jgi:hypothetical protein
MTNYRKLQQTEANEASGDRRITPAAENAITITQGHSREVAEKFYKLKDLSEASSLAIKTHEELYGIQEIPDISSEEDEAYLPHEEKEEEVIKIISYVLT